MTTAQPDAASDATSGNTSQNTAPGIPNADHLEDDAFGYSCYALVLPAQESIRTAADAIERAAGMTRAKIPAHITVKGTFYAIASLDEVKARVATITGQTPALEIPLAGAQAHWGTNGGGLRVVATSALQTLHDALVAAIAPLGKPAYQDDPYRPHMTFVQDVTPEGLATAQSLVAATDLGPVFRADFVDLMGRQGKAHGGQWLCIQRFALAGASRG